MGEFHRPTACCSSVLPTLCAERRYPHPFSFLLLSLHTQLPPSLPPLPRRARPKSQPNPGRHQSGESSSSSLARYTTTRRKTSQRSFPCSPRGRRRGKSISPSPLRFPTSTLNQTPKRRQHTRKLLLLSNVCFYLLPLFPGKSDLEDPPKKKKKRSEKRPSRKKRVKLFM